MVDTLEQIANPIVTVCMGKAMSCGAILLSCGHIRFCAPHSRVMVHEVSSATSGDAHDMSNDVAETLRLNQLFLGLLAKNCGIKGGFKGVRQLIKQHDGRELWMSPEKALEFGIVDEIGTPQFIPHVIYDLVTVPSNPRAKKVQHARAILGLEE